MSHGIEACKELWTVSIITGVLSLLIFMLLLANLYEYNQGTVNLSLYYDKYQLVYKFNIFIFILLAIGTAVTTYTQTDSCSDTHLTTYYQITKWFYVTSIILMSCMLIIGILCVFCAHMCSIKKNFTVSLTNPRADTVYNNNYQEAVDAESRV